MRRRTLLPIISTLLLIFFLLSSCGKSAETSVQAEESLPAAASNTGVILDSTADIFSEPDVKSHRISQAIFNQSVEILEEEDGWSRITAPDGNTGWIKSKLIGRETSSIDPKQHYKYKIVITSRDKKITSRPNGGVTVKETSMGTVLFSRGKIENNYEVVLPGVAAGWVSESGTIQVALDEKIPVTSASDFVSTAIKFKGTSYLDGGLTSWGIDGPGLVYISAEINGIQVPRDLKGLYGSGSSVDIKVLSPGDLLFFSGIQNPEGLASVGIYTGNSKFLQANATKGYVTVNSLEENHYNERLIAARRIFPH